MGAPPHDVIPAANFPTSSRGTRTHASAPLTRSTSTGMDTPVAPRNCLSAAVQNERTWSASSLMPAGDDGEYVVVVVVVSAESSTWT